ncbi:hypothetical protein C1N71_00360 [Agrococcus sp. SGAir0287]|nr:hypothetical protein C1N71_00360 [Agrococcus sp. SGAir0287]
MHVHARSAARARTAAIVETYTMQRSRMRQLLATELDVDVLLAAASLQEIVRWLRSTRRDAWPELVVVGIHDGVDPVRLRAVLVPLRAQDVRIMAVVGAPDRRDAPRPPAELFDGAAAVDDAETAFVETVRAVAAGRDAVTERARRTLERHAAAPRLSVQEERVLSLYASGMTIGAVAEAIGVREDTARVYLRRVRAKYRAVGQTASTKIDLARVAWRDGYLSSDAGSVRSREA